MHKSKIVLSFLLVSFFLFSCTTSIETDSVTITPDQSTMTVTSEASEDNASVDEASLTETSITIDGDPSDWGKYDVLLSDPDGDHQGGEFDITAVSAFINDEYLYVLVETHQPPNNYVQVDLDIMTPENSFIVSFQPQNHSLGNMGDVTSGDYVEIGEITGSESAAGQSIELKIPLSVLQNLEDLQLKIRPMAGLCCTAPDWFVMDETSEFVVPHLDEIEPAIDLTLPAKSPGAAYVVEQDMTPLHCDEPGDVVTSPDGLTAYVTCRNVDMLYVIETETNQVIDMISLKETAEHPFGPAPGKMSISHDGTMLFVVNEMDESITLIDTTSHEILKTFSLGVRFWAPPVFQSDGQYAYFIGGPASQLVRIDLLNFDVQTLTMFEIVAPLSIALAQDEQSIYVVDMAGKFIQVDLNSYAVWNTLELSNLGWRGDLVLTADGNFAYINAVENDFIAEINLVDMVISRKIEIQKPQTLLLDEEDQLLYVGTFNSFLDIAPVAVVDLIEGEVVYEINLTTPAPHVAWPADIEGLAFVGDGSRIYVPTVDADCVYIIDTASHSHSSTIPMTDYAELQPEKLVINSDGSRLYTVNIAPQAPSISIINTLDNTVDNKYYLQPHDPCFGSATSLDITPDNDRIFLSTDQCILTFDVDNSEFVHSTPIDLSEGSTIRDLAVSPTQDVLYTIDSNGIVSVIDRTSLEVNDTVQAVMEGYNLKVSPDGTRVYVTGLRQYAVIDAESNSFIISDFVFQGEDDQFSEIPDRQIGIPDNQAFYIIGDFAYMLIYDKTTHQLIHTIRLESEWAPERGLSTDVIFNSDDSIGYLAMWDLKGVIAFDTTSWELIAQIDTGYYPVMGISPNDFAISPDDSLLYVSCEQSDNIVVINTEMNKVIAVIDLLH